MSTHRGAYARRGQPAARLEAIRPAGGLKVYQCSFCKDRLASAHHVIPHEAACRMRDPVQQMRAYAWRRFVRQWEAR